MNEPKCVRSTLTRLVCGTSPRRTLVRCLVLVVVCLVVFKFLFLPVRVHGGSMLPAYSSRGINFVNRLAYRRAQPRRGDVVAIWPRESSRRVVLMKRVVGLPGETVGFRDGRVVVDGVPLNEPYVRYASDWNLEPVRCGPDEYFVVGDNRSMPMDGHWFGRAKAQLIAGRMVL
ncbi:MAG: signal peptidase I [Verrucomicrobia bacterium]|jgi:signal peptidase I|nr:signal peptidase I [Verrucomicrobiota bacterium]